MKMNKFKIIVLIFMITLSIFFGVLILTLRFPQNNIGVFSLIILLILFVISIIAFLSFTFIIIFNKDLPNEYILGKTMKITIIVALIIIPITYFILFNPNRVP